MIIKKTAAHIFAYIKRHRVPILIVSILAIAILFRLYKLSSLPPGLHPDEAANGLDIVQRVLKGDIRAIYNTNGPRESLFIFAQALFVKLFGNTILALRIAPAIFGILGVFTTYLWSKSWFGTRVALLSSFLLAVNPWSVTLSRDGYRASMLPLAVTLTLWLYTIAAHTKKRLYYALAGASLGLGLYTYISYRLFIMSLLILAGYAIAFKRTQLKPHAKQLMYSLIIALIILIPLIAHGIKTPSDLTARVSDTSILNTQLNHGRPLYTLQDSLVKTLLMFNIRGDSNYRHNFASKPALNIFVGVVFLIGVGKLLLYIRRIKYFALLIFLACMLLPTILTYEGIPHFLRSIGALPFVMVISALGITSCMNFWSNRTIAQQFARIIGAVTVFVLLVLTAFGGYRQYFIDWAHSPSTYSAYYENIVAEADYMLTKPNGADWYVVIDTYSNKITSYLTWNKVEYTRIDPNNPDILPNTDKPMTIIISRGHENVINNLNTLHGASKQTKIYSRRDGSYLFTLYEVY